MSLEVSQGRNDNEQMERQKYNSYNENGQKNHSTKVILELYNNFTWLYNLLMFTPLIIYNN